MSATIFWVVLASLSLLASAISVGCCLGSLHTAKEIRSLRSLQGEIAEIDACVASIIATIRRMEGRQTARLNRTSNANDSGTTPVSLMDKDSLRRYAGLVPGKPASHKNGDDTRDST